MSMRLFYISRFYVSEAGYMGFILFFEFFYYNSGIYYQHNCPSTAINIFIALHILFLW